MGYLLTAILMFMVTLIAEVVFVVLVGAAGALVAPIAFMGGLIIEMVRLARNGETTRALAVSVSGLSILIPATYALVAYPDIPTPFFVLDALLGSSLDPANFSEVAAASILLLMIAWFLGGGYLVANVAERIADERHKTSGRVLLGLSLFVVAWGITASPIIGWILGGMAELAQSWF